MLQPGSVMCTMFLVLDHLCRSFPVSSPNPPPPQSCAACRVSSNAGMA